MSATPTLDDLVQIVSGSSQNAARDPAALDAAILKENHDDTNLRMLLAEMTAAGDPTGGINLNAKPSRPRSTPFHGVVLVYSRKCMWQACMAALVGRKVATIEVNSPGEFPESEDALALLKSTPTAIVINSSECARKISEISGVSQVVSCVESPLSIAELLSGDSHNDKIIEESYDGLYAWLGMSPTGVYICDYIRIACGIGQPSIYGEIKAEDARNMITGLKMSGLIADDGTGGDVPRWAVGDIKSTTYGARGFDNVNNFIVVGQTLETHRICEFTAAAKSAPTLRVNEHNCLLVNCIPSETSINLAAAQPVHAVMFFTLHGNEWLVELHPGALSAPIAEIAAQITGEGAQCENKRAVFSLSIQKLSDLMCNGC